MHMAQTMFTTEEVDLDELTEEELAEWSELLEGDLTIRTLYNKYANAYVGGERSHKPAEKAITKVHGKKVMGHLRKAAKANANGDMDREYKHFERARDAAGDSERLGSSVGRNRSAFRKQFEEAEQIDEIGDTPAGRKKLGNYVKKASVAATGHAQDYEGSKEYPGELDSSGNEKHYRKMDNRLTGIHRAINKLTKEEVEEQEEQE
jgi:hypothetical protein